jgi:hypothetical protein
MGAVTYAQELCMEACAYQEVDRGLELTKFSAIPSRVHVGWHGSCQQCAVWRGAFVPQFRGMASCCGEL